MTGAPWSRAHPSCDQRRLRLKIAEALKANPTLEAAQAALRQAWENVYAEQGAFFPTVAANSLTSSRTF